MGESFWQKDSLITQILFELWLITLLWIVSVFLTQTLVKECPLINFPFNFRPLPPYNMTSFMNVPQTRDVSGQENIDWLVKRAKHDNALSTLSVHGLGQSGHSRRENICPRK